jgi:hypothetical protein
LPALARPAKAAGKEPIQLVYPELADNIWIWFTLAFSPPRGYSIHANKFAPCGF